MTLMGVHIMVCLWLHSTSWVLAVRAVLCRHDMSAGLDQGRTRCLAVAALWASLHLS